MAIWVGQDGTLNDTDGDGAAAPGSDEQQQAGPAEQPAPEQPEQSPQAPPPMPPPQQDQQQQMQPPIPPPKRRKKRHHHHKHGKKSGGSAQFIPAKPIFQTSGELVGWMYPFTDYDGYEFMRGPGQYRVYETLGPVYPATEPANIYPDPDEETYEEREAGSQDEAYASASTPLDLLDEEQLASLPYPDEFFTGFAMPFTDWDGNVLTAKHPRHLDYPWPETYGPPVWTGWSAPFTDLGGHLLQGPGQYGTFTVEDPFDHRRWDDVELARLDPEDNRMYRFLVGQDDLGSTLGSALGSAFGGDGGGGGGGGGGMGDLGSSIGNLFSSDGGGSDLGSALGSVASAAAKVAIPALAKAGTQALSQELSKPHTQQPSAPPPPGHPVAHAHRASPRTRLLQQVNHLADKYGITRPQAHAATGNELGPFEDAQSYGDAHNANLIASYMRRWQHQDPTFIANLQRSLGIRADGIVGHETHEAIARWQGRFGHIPTGVMDFATMNALSLG